MNRPPRTTPPPPPPPTPPHTTLGSRGCGGRGQRAPRVHWSGALPGPAVIPTRGRGRSHRVRPPKDLRGGRGGTGRASDGPMDSNLLSERLRAPWRGSQRREAKKVRGECRDRTAAILDGSRGSRETRRTCDTRRTNAGGSGGDFSCRRFSTAPHRMNPTRAIPPLSGHACLCFNRSRISVSNS